MSYLFAILSLIGLLLLLVLPKCIQLVLDKFNIRIPFKGYLLSFKWNGYLYCKINFVSWNRVQFILVLNHFDLIIHRRLNGNINHTSSKTTHNKPFILPSIIQNTTFWAWCSFVSIELQNVSLQFHVSDTQCITLESMNFTLNNIHHNGDHIAHVSQSIVFSSSSFKILLNNTTFVDFYTLRIHALIHIDSLINNDTSNAIHGIDIKWKGFKLYLNPQTTEFMLIFVQQNKQNQSVQHKHVQTQSLPCIPRYVSIDIHYVAIDIMHHNESLQFGVKSLHTKLFMDQSMHMDMEHSLTLFCDAYGSNRPYRYNLMEIQCQIMSTLSNDDKTRNSLCVDVVESCVHVNPTLLSWIDKAIEYKLYLIRHNVLSSKSHDAQTQPRKSGIDRLLEWKTRNVVIEYKVNNSVLNICDASDDLTPAYSFSITSFETIFTTSHHMQHHAHLFMHLDCMTFSLGHLITQNMTRFNQITLNLILLNIENESDGRCIDLMFDVAMESISIGVNHEYLSTATELIPHYDDVLLSLISKLSANKHTHKTKPNTRDVIRSKGQIKCKKWTVFTCFTEHTDDQKYDTNEVTVQASFKQIQIMKHLSKEYLNTPNDLRSIPTMPTIFQWIVEFQSFQIVVSSESSTKRQPLLRVLHSKCEQYAYVEDHPIRDVWIGELGVQWNILHHLSLCRLFHSFYIHTQQLQSKVSPFLHITSNAYDVQKVPRIEEEDEDEIQTEAVRVIPTLFSTNSLEIDLKFDYKSNDATIHLYIDKVERPSYLTVYRDRFEALNIDIFSSSIRIKPDRSVFLPYILHEDTSLHDAYIECYKQYYNQQDDVKPLSTACSVNPSKTAKLSSPQKSYFQNKRRKSRKRSDEHMTNLRFHSAKDDKWNTFVLQHGSFGIGTVHDLIEFDHLKLYHSLKPDNAYLEPVSDLSDQIDEEYYHNNTHQPNLNLSFGVFTFKLPHQFYFGDALLDWCLKRWKAFKMWFKYTLMELPQSPYHVPIALDIANIIISANEFQIEFKEDPAHIKALIDQFMTEDTLDEKFEYFNHMMNRWSFGKGFNIHNEHDLSMIFENVFRICGNKLYIALELDEECLTLNDTLRTLQRLDSYQPLDDAVTSIHPWYELWAKHLIVKANHVSATISGYALPLISTPYLEVDGTFILGQLLCPKQRFIERQSIELSPSVHVELESHEFIPTKVYYDLNAKIYGKESLLAYGKCMEPGLDKLSLCLDRIAKSVPPLRFGPLSWWDKLRMKVHGNIEINVKHTIICVTKSNHTPNYLSVDVDHGLLVSKRQVFSVLAHSVSMQVMTPPKFFHQFDIFKVKDIGGMHDIAAVNKDHTMARIHFLKINTRCEWESKQKDPFQHYFHHTYWSKSFIFEDAIPDVDLDLYQRYRAEKLTLKFKIEIKAPTQQHAHNKTFLPGVDLRLWWQCKDWLKDLLDTLAESSSTPNKPELGPLLEPITLECSVLYPSCEILHILKEKQQLQPQDPVMPSPQDLVIDLDEATMSNSPNPYSPRSPSIIKFTRKAKDYIRRTNSLSEDGMHFDSLPQLQPTDSVRSMTMSSEIHPRYASDLYEPLNEYTHRLLGMRVRAKELLFRTKFIRSSQEHPLLDAEIVTTEADDVWLMKGKYLKLSKPKLELIVPSTKAKTKDVFYHVSPFKSDNCYGDFDVVRFARSTHLVFSDMGYHKAEESVTTKQNKFKFPRPIDTFAMNAPQYTKYRPPPLDSIPTTNSLPASPPMEAARNPSSGTLKNRTSSVNVLLNTEMLKLNRTRASVDNESDSLPSSRCTDLSTFDQHELIQSLADNVIANISSPDDSMSPIKFMKEDLNHDTPTMRQRRDSARSDHDKVRRNSFQLASDLLRSPSIFDSHIWDEQPGNSTIYDSFVCDDLKLLWNQPIRQTTLHWWPLLFEKSKEDDDKDEKDDDDETDENDDDDIRTEEMEFDDAQKLVSSLSQLLESASNNQKPRIVTDDDDGEGAMDKERKDGVQKDDDGGAMDGRQPVELEYYKQRLWLVHLQRPQIKFEALDGDAVLLGAHHAFVQGFGFHLELLPNKSKDILNRIGGYLPPQEMIYRLNNTQFYDDVMPYFKIRICGSLIDAQMFVAPYIDHVDKWIGTDQLQHKSITDETRSRSKTRTPRRKRSRESHHTASGNIKIKKDNVIKAVVGHCKLQFAYSYDLEIPNNYAHKILPFHWRSFAENNIISGDYETDSFVPHTAASAIHSMPLLVRNKINTSNLTSPISPQNALIRHLYRKSQQPQPHSAHSFTSDQFSNRLLPHNSSTSVTPSSSQHTLQQSNTFMINNQTETENVNEQSTKPRAYTEWIGRQHIPFIDHYEGDPTSNIKVYLPSFVGKLDPYQFQTFINVINFVLLASHQSDDQMNDDVDLIDKENISITKQQRHRIQRELQQTVNKSVDTKHGYAVHKTPLKIVEYQANSISWKMADINSNTFLNTEITNLTGTHTLCSDLSREAEVELQHFQVTQPTMKTEEPAPSSSHLLATPSPSKYRSSSLDLTENSGSEQSLFSDSIESNSTKRTKKKKKRKIKFFNKSQQILNNIFKSKSISPPAPPCPADDDDAEEEEDEIQILVGHIGEPSPVKDDPPIAVSDPISMEMNATNKVMIQPQPEAWKRFKNNAIKQRSRRMMLTIHAENAKSHPLKSCEMNIRIPLYRHLEINLFPIRIDLDLKHAKYLRDYFFIVTENQTKNKSTIQHKKQFLDYYQSSSLNTVKSFSFSDQDQKTGEAFIMATSPPPQTTSHHTSNSISNQKYFHRIRIGRLSFDVSFTGWVKDIHKDISVSTFIWSKRLSTWSKLIHSLGSHAFRNVVFGSDTHRASQLQLDNLLIDKKKKKKFKNLNDTAKRQRLLFGHNTLQTNIDDVAEVPMDAICAVEVDFSKDALIKMMTQNNNTSGGSGMNSDDDAYDEDLHLQELFTDSLIVQLIHDRLVLELRTVLEHVRGVREVQFEFQIINKLKPNDLKLKLFLRKLGEEAEMLDDIDELDLCEKYRICVQNLIVAKCDTKQHNTNLNLSDIVKYLYNAKNITIQPIKSYLN
eukprot:110421_1